MNLPDSSASPIIFLATPLHDDRVHYAYMSGVMDLVDSARGRVIIAKLTSQALFMSRDILTAQFLRSKATHLLWVDSDMGWTAADVQLLLDTGRDFVGGLYAIKKQELEFASGQFGAQDGELVEVRRAATGFLLLSRRCVERMVAAYPELQYQTPYGPAWALWSPIFDRIPYGEDVSFGMRWAKLGEKLWVHSKVILKHFGEHTYAPEQADVARALGR